MSHSGQLSIWNQKTLVQNEYDIYIYMKIRRKDLTWLENTTRNKRWKIWNGMIYHSHSEI